MQKFTKILEKVEIQKDSGMSAKKKKILYQSLKVIL